MIILADDDMQGREAGTENYDKAADYVINNFKELGIQPLPNNNESYLQPIKFTETRLDLTSPKMSITNGTESIDLCVSINCFSICFLLLFSSIVLIQLPLLMNETPQIFDEVSIDMIFFLLAIYY